MNVRRSFIYTEHSIDNGTQWAVFQPIDVQFALTASSSPMRQNDIDNGRSICGVGIASLRLVKFVIFRRVSGGGESGSGGVGAEGVSHNVSAVSNADMSRSSVAVLLSMGTLACGPSIHPRLATVTPEQLKPPRTISLSASSSLHGPSIADDAQLLRKLTAAVHRYLPQVSVVDGLGDLDVIVVIVNYEPGCAPNCTKFPTYRNWSCTVLSFGPPAQAFALEGSTYNPFVSPTDDCIRRLSEYLRKNALLP